MALYKQEQAGGETALDDVAFEVYNSKSGADADEYLAAYAGMSDTVKALIRASLHEGATEPRADELLADIRGKLKPDCVGRVYDAWASDVSFDPNRVGCEKAAWIARDGQNNQAAFKARLVKDDCSPCGFAWFTEPYSWDRESRRWKEEADSGGIWWGYQSPAALEAGIPEVEGVDWKDEGLRIVRVQPDLLDDLGVGDDMGVPRPAYGHELDAAARTNWALDDQPDPPTALKGWLSKLTDEQIAPELREKAVDAAVSTVRAHDSMEVIDTGYKCAHGSIDIVAKRHGALYFVQTRLTELSDPEQLAFPKPFDLGAEPTMSPFKREFIDSASAYLDDYRAEHGEYPHAYFGVLDVVTTSERKHLATRWELDAFNVRPASMDRDYERAVLSYAMSGERLAHPVEYVKFPHPSELNPVNSKWQNALTGSGSGLEPLVVLKERDGLWSCSVSMSAGLQAYMTAEAAESFIDAYSNAFDALSGQCELSNMVLITYNPADPSHPYDSVAELREREGFGAGWKPMPCRDHDAPANGAESIAVPAPVRDAPPARGRR